MKTCVFVLGGGDHEDLCVFVFVLGGGDHEDLCVCVRWRRS